MPDMHETVLAFDYGLRRIGLAIGQHITSSANPVGVIANGESGPDWDQIAHFLKEWRPGRLIVGMPSRIDGSRSDIADHVDEFIIDLGRFDLPIETVDERYTSVEAQAMLNAERKRGLRGRIKKDMIDSAAATLIAERWLNKTG